MAGKSKSITLDGDNSRPIFSPTCTTCNHWTPKADANRSCTAFPTGTIPKEIWMGENNHQSPYEGDNGIQFELMGAEENGKQK